MPIIEKHEALVRHKGTISYYWYPKMMNIFHNIEAWEKFGNDEPCREMFGMMKPRREKIIGIMKALWKILGLMNPRSLGMLKPDWENFILGMIKPHKENLWINEGPQESSGKIKPRRENFGDDEPHRENFVKVNSDRKFCEWWSPTEKIIGIMKARRESSGLN